MSINHLVDNKEEFMIRSACCSIDSSFIISLASFLVTVATLVVTTITLFWFQNERRHKNEKEFLDTWPPVRLRNERFCTDSDAAHPY